MMVLIISDNETQLLRFRELVKRDEFKDYVFNYSASFNNKVLLDKYPDWLKPVKVKDSVIDIIENYELIISVHCKQLFPAALVNNVRCVNVHPGLNPHNRGWFPQVFSIINGLPVGATIHEIDEKLDHGGIIVQEEVIIEAHDTSISLYNRVLEVEIKLLEKNLASILKGEYETQIASEGNLNLKKDFNALCELDLNHTGTMQQHINMLRALTHGTYKNAFFVNEKGEKVYISVELEKA